MKRLEALKGVAERASEAQVKLDHSEGSLYTAAACLLEEVVETVKFALPAVVGKVHGLSVEAVRITSQKADGAEEVLYLDGGGNWVVIAARDSERQAGGFVYRPKPENVVEDWSVPVIVVELEARFRAVVEGKAAERARDMLERADRLNAITVLLKGVRL